VIEHTRDFRRVVKLAPWPIRLGPECHYLLEVAGGEDVGLWFFEPLGADMSVHVVMTDKCRGLRAKESGKAAFDWVFRHTDTESILAAIDSSRKDVAALARALGFNFLFSDKAGQRHYRIDRHRLASKVECSV